MATNLNLLTLQAENVQLRKRLAVLEHAAKGSSPAPTSTTLSSTPSPPPSTTTSDPTSPADFQEWGQSILAWLVNYRQQCQTLPVISTVQPNYLRDALPSAAPTSGEPWENIMADLDTLIVPGLTHWESQRRFFAYFKPHASYPAVLGETLCAGLNVMGFDWIASPACTELEVVTLDWLAQILNLPSCFLSSATGPGGGVIQGSAGESATVVLTAAIERTRSSSDEMSVSGGPLRRDLMVVYGSDQTHTIVKKACMILGVRWRALPTTKEYNWSLQPHTLEEALSEDRAKGLLPIACVATTGTTSSCAFDPVRALSKVCKNAAAGNDLWLHIDAAYGGAYACLPELSEQFDGIDQADSFCVNCHKKLLCPFDLAALYVRDRDPILRALSVDSEYLRNEASDSGAVVDFEHWQLPLGRRFRALKLWFVLRRFGKDGIIAHVRKGMQLRQILEKAVRKDPIFEIAAPPSLSLICFRLAGVQGEDGNEVQHHFLRALKKTGECFVIHTKLGNDVVIRMACGGLEQTDEDVLSAWAVIDRVSKETETKNMLASAK